jgi:hypothetical protein
MTALRIIYLILASAADSAEFEYVVLSRDPLT